MVWTLRIAPTPRPMLRAAARAVVNEQRVFEVVAFMAERFPRRSQAEPLGRFAGRSACSQCARDAIAGQTSHWFSSQGPAHRAGVNLRGGCDSKDFDSIQRAALHAALRTLMKREADTARIEPLGFPDEAQFHATEPSRGRFDLATSVARVSVGRGELERLVHRRQHSAVERHRIRPRVRAREQRCRCLLRSVHSSQQQGQRCTASGCRFPWPARSRFLGR